VLADKLMDLVLLLFVGSVDVLNRKQNSEAIPPLAVRRYFCPADNATAGESDAMWDLATLELPANCWSSTTRGNLNTGIRVGIVGTT
jgi:hypothetical protein